MSTYTEMQTSLRAMLSRTDLDSFITEGIRRAIKAYEREPFYFNERSQTLTVSSAATSYTLSSSFVEMLSDPTITINGSVYTLGQISKSEYDQKKITSTTSQPSEYCLYAGQFFPYPPPDSSYVAVLNYTTRLSTLSAGVDSNAWTTQAEELIESRTLWWIHSFKTRNQQQAQTAKAAELEALRFLREESTGKKATGTIKATQF
jgi:hypothetical protein